MNPRKQQSGFTMIEVLVTIAILVVGLLGLAATPFIAPEIGMPLLMSAVILAAFVSIYESWRVWRLDPDRA